MEYLEVGEATEAHTHDAEPPSGTIAVRRLHTPVVASLASAAALFRDTEFGSREMRTRFFALEDRWTFVNHGAFGGTLRWALDVAARWARRCEAQPLRFVDREVLPSMVQSVRAVARYCGADARDVLPFPNVTTALNAALQSVQRELPVAHGDAWLMLDLAYGSVKKLVRDLAARGGAAVVEVPIDLSALRALAREECDAHEPLDASERGRAIVIGAVREALEHAQREHAAGRGPRVRVATFDWISSNTALLLPVRELCALCREFGVLSVIDGAHALGAVHPLALPDVGADMIACNAHKWFCSPKGAAFLWLARERHALLKPLIVSHGAAAGLLSAFVWTGMRYYAPFLTMRALIEFWSAHGNDARTAAFCAQRRREGAALLARRWGTELLAPAGMFTTMATVRLPGAPVQAHDPDENVRLQDRLYYDHAVEAPIKKLDGHLYIRISAHVYNTLEEYDRVASAVLALRTSAATERA